MALIKYDKHYLETLKQMLDRFRDEFPEYRNEKITYAGRLDPLAEGLVLVLTGTDCKNKQPYLALDKTYQVDVIFGIATDSYDVLGLVTEVKHCSHDNLSHIQQALRELTGKREVPYPIFSSRTVSGKPLWKWAQEGLLADINIPRHHEEVYSASILEQSYMNITELSYLVGEITEAQRGNFRQGEIQKSWEQLPYRFKKVPTLSLELSVSSGTYVRTFVHELGKKIGCGACSLRIKRTSIGTINLENDKA